MTAQPQSVDRRSKVGRIILLDLYTGKNDPRKLGSSFQVLMHYKFTHTAIALCVSSSVPAVISTRTSHLHPSIKSKLCGCSLHLNLLPMPPPLAALTLLTTLSLYHPPALPLSRLLVPLPSLLVLLTSHRSRYRFFDRPHHTPSESTYHQSTTLSDGASSQALFVPQVTHPSSPLSSTEHNAPSEPPHPAESHVPLHECSSSTQSHPSTNYGFARW